MKLWSKVYDKKREIEGVIVKVLKEEFHVEYKRFKGDEEPFYISYPFNSEDIIFVKENKVSSNYLTIGRLKKSILESGLSDNSPVFVEMISPEENWKNKITVLEGSLEETKAVQAWCASPEKKDNYLMIWVNY